MLTSPIRVSKETLRDLVLLKLAWNKRSLDEVVRELVRQHGIDRVKALNIETPKDFE